MPGVTPPTNHQSPQPVAVIDIGSNTAKLSVMAAEQGRLIEVTHATLPMKLVRAVDAKGMLSAEAEERVGDMLDRFATIAHDAGASQVVAVATSAIRDAANGAEVIARLRVRTGVDVRVISGESEAQYSLAGAMEDTGVRNGMLLDVGGGSVEIAHFREGVLRQAWSRPLGSLRLADSFLTSDPPRAEEIAALVAFVDAQLDEMGVPMLASDEELIGVGGTIRNLTTLRDSAAVPGQVPGGTVLATADVVAVAKALDGTTAAQRRTWAGLAPERAESIVGGGAVVRAVMHHIGARRLTVSANGVRAGVALEMMGLRSAAEWSVAGGGMHL